MQQLEARHAASRVAREEGCLSMTLLLLAGGYGRPTLPPGPPCGRTFLNILIGLAIGAALARLLIG